MSLVPSGDPRIRYPNARIGWTPVKSFNPPCTVSNFRLGWIPVAGLPLNPGLFMVEKRMVLVRPYIRQALLGNGLFIPLTVLVL